MTCQLDTIILCDGTLYSGRNCPEMYATGDEKTSHAEARDRAADAGWTHRDGNDYCPGCSEGVR